MKKRRSLAAALAGVFSATALVAVVAAPANAAAGPTSQNGWPVITSSRSTLLGSYSMPGVKETKKQIRKGDAAKLLLDFATWFDTHVESLKKCDKSCDERGDEWGYYYRKVRGSTTVYSNHASGTALDLNATQHPLATSPSATFSKAEIAKIHARLKRYDGAIRWGGDYTGRKDPMHFEINKSPAQVHKVVLKLFPPPPPPPLCGHPAIAGTATPACIPPV